MPSNQKSNSVCFPSELLGSDFRGQECPRHTPSRKLQSDKFRGMGSYICQRVGVAAREPLRRACLEMAWHRALAFYVTADFQIRHRHEQMWATVMVRGNHATGLQFDLGNSHSVFYEQNV